MTQYTTGSRNEHDLTKFAMYKVLWSVVPFVRLPEDAPLELMTFAIEIQDPRRVYTIHKAARRHDFQILLDRFIDQIRYGCGYKFCSTTTCFSCRRRLTNGPIRRYNATSARILAFYMISLDYPERELCPHQALRRMNEKSKLSKSHILALKSGSKSPPNNEKKVDNTSTQLGLETPEGSTLPGMTEEKMPEENPKAHLDTLDQITIIDHRSFIQNMFETTAIKIAEWLKPQNVKNLAGPRTGIETKPFESTSRRKYSDLYAHSPSSPGSRILQREDDTILNGRDTRVAQPLNELNRPYLSEEKSSHSAQSQQASSDIHKKNFSENLAYQSTKSWKLAEESSDVSFLSTAGVITVASQNMELAKKSIPFKCQSHDRSAHSGRMVEDNLPPRDIRATPQSLCYLTIEIIQLMCSILQTDQTYEIRSSVPLKTVESVDRKQNIMHRWNTLRRKAPQEKENSYPNTAKKQWKDFIEQCFFDVLTRPKSLLKSFRDENAVLFDSQTIWYLIRQMIRVKPTIVFDSLWNVIGTLFRPPKIIEEAYDCAGDPLSNESRHGKAVSDHDAAEILCICIHALIAEVPLIEDYQQIAGLSCIRSRGLTLSAKDSTSAELVALCLLYDDAFTNELAMRLARKVFKAIITRLKFSELLSRHKISGSIKPEPNVLQIIISMIESLSSRFPPILDFSKTEREVHEKRVPHTILDWARAVILNDWRDNAEVLQDSPSGGALATIATIYKSRRSLLLNDAIFQTDYFAEHLDSIKTPIEWHSFKRNKKTVHLLDYPYLFNQTTLISYFRAINYSRMTLAHETAKYDFVRMTSSMHERNLITDAHTLASLQERLRIATSRFMVMEIRRNHVLLDTFNSIWRREERELLRPLKLRLGEDDGESGSDSGGVQQEYLRLAIAEALNPDYGTFTVDSRTRMTWFQPGSPEPLWKYELIGMVMSLAVYNGLTLPVTFPKAFYKKLLGKEVSELHHIEDGWPDLTNGLTSLLEWDEKNGLIEDVFARTYEFTVEHYGQPVSVEMTDSGDDDWPSFWTLSKSDVRYPTNNNAPFVTSLNREKYVKDYIRYLTNISIKPQFEAFKKGFFACLTYRSVRIFDAPTLQSLIEGVQVIDVDELRHATRYIGWDGEATHHTVKDFWMIVQNYNLEMRRKLLEFVTASDRLPVGGTRTIQFTIQRNGIEDGLLPTSYTCYGILLLPEYSDKQILEERLTMALENSKGFGFA